MTSRKFNVKKLKKEVTLFNIDKNGLTIYELFDKYKDNNNFVLPKKPKYKAYASNLYIDKKVNNEIILSHAPEIGFTWEEILKKYPKIKMNDWDVSNLHNMSWMFYNAKSFNQDISNWNVSNVTNMSSMFSDATSFNADISNWDISSVTDMKYMFYNANSFKQDLTKWNINRVEEIYGIFDLCEHKYEINKFSKYKIKIYLNHINPKIIHIGGFAGTQEESIKFIKKYYKTKVEIDGNIKMMNELFDMVKNENIIN